MKKTTLLNEFKGIVWIAVLSLTLAVSVNAFRPDGLPWVEDWEQRLSSRDLPEGVLGFDIEEIVEFQRWGAALLLDAREFREYMEERIPGALSLPLYQFDEVFPQLEEDFMHAALIITYCGDLACTMGEDLAVKLLMHGYPNVGAFLGGMKQWKQAGRAVETGPPRVRP